jgi:hypothetical protein
LRPLPLARGPSTSTSCIRTLPSRMRVARNVVASPSDIPARRASSAGVIGPPSRRHSRIALSTSSHQFSIMLPLHSHVSHVPHVSRCGHHTHPSEAQTAEPDRGRSARVPNSASRSLDRREPLPAARCSRFLSCVRSAAGAGQQPTVHGPGSRCWRNPSTARYATTLCASPQDVAAGAGRPDMHARYRPVIAGGRQIPCHRRHRGTGFRSARLVAPAWYTDWARFSLQRFP